jgi:L-threonylcarbamoyladenylate synthase
MKNRLVEQGVLLVAGNITQVEEYASLTASSQISQIRATWPGPVTWTLKPNNKMPLWVVGQHNTVAIRVSGHSVCIDLCNEFSGAIVSTSANRHGQAVLKTWQEVEQEFLGDIDYIVRAEIGGRDAPSQIRDGETGEVLR